MNAPRPQPKRVPLEAWLRFLRVVNLPTVPGDVFSGAAVACAFCPRVHGDALAVILPTALASVLLYMFGLADNDIVGAGTDTDRPIPQGLISLRAARLARSLCLLVAAGIGLAAKLPAAWWLSAFGLAVVVVLYNRTKNAVLMGLCRGLDVVCGATALAAIWSPASIAAVAAAALVWTAYIGAVTKYSEGEQTDPDRKRRVGILIGALVWLQLAVVAVFACVFHTYSLLAAQLAMLAALLLLKRLLPFVSAS